MADLPGNESLQQVHEAIAEGQLDEALGLLRRLEERRPGDPEVYNLAGQCLLQLGDLKSSLDAFQRATRVRADWPDPFLGAAETLARQGDAHRSMQVLLHVLDFAPGHVHATRQLADLLGRVRPDRHLPELEPALVQCFAHPDIDPTPLTKLCGQQLRLGIADIPEPPVERLAENTLWQLYLSRTINTDPQLEKLFTRLRRHLCLGIAIEESDAAPVNFIISLALQCFQNEYVFDISDEEADRLAAIDAVLEGAGEASGSIALAFALGCLYRPPGLGPATRSMAASLADKHDWLASLCHVTVFEPWEEARLAETIPTLRAIRNDASLAVQEQYESNPYPRWRAPPVPAPADFLRSARRRFSLRAETETPAAGTRCLVAGCGTGFEPIDIARRDSSVAITAIDLSRRSLAYATRQAEILGCSNIEFVHGDILDLSDTDAEFDLIVCTGVLHHMAEPLAGWRVLRDKLADTGMMRIGLYSKSARRVISQARELIAARGLSATADDIRRFRQSILSEGPGSELSVLQGSDDFYSMSGCRDLLFHALEHQFTLPEIAAALDELGLRFCGFDPGNTAILEAFAAENAAALLDLDRWDRFELAHPDAFSEMYQFWCEPIPA